MARTATPSDRSPRRGGGSARASQQRVGAGGSDAAPRSREGARSTTGRRLRGDDGVEPSTASSTTQRGATRSGASARKATAKKATAKKKSMPKKTTAKTTTAKKATPRKTTAKTTAARKATPKQTTAKKTTARKATPGKTTGRTTAAGKAARTRLADEHPMASNITPEQALENTRRLLEQRAGASRTPPGLQPTHPPAEAIGDVGAPDLGRDGERLRGFPPLPRNSPGRGGGRHH